MKTKGFKLSFNPQRAFYSLLKILFVIVVVWCIASPVIMYLGYQEKPYKTKIIEKWSSTSGYKTLEFETLDGKYHFSVTPTESWYKSAKIGDLHTRSRAYLYFDEMDNIVIVPYTSGNLNPNSYDVTLNEKIVTYKSHMIDVKEDNETESYIIEDNGFVMIPGVLYLGRTNEYTETKGFIPGIEGKSSLARLGIQVHMTAGFGDVGFKGFWTLEMTCVHPVRIYKDMRIAQLYYDDITGNYEDYKGKYNKNNDIEASKSFNQVY